VIGEEGVVVLVVTVDGRTGQVLSGPEVITRGWVHAAEAEDLLAEARERVAAALDEALAEGVPDIETMKRTARRALGAFVNERTRRRPMIVPIVMEV